ncbi:MAG TPA: hypothetical protein VFN90_07110 [Gemmatimonadales bacterium]|nr:hypothetical protein [Gemmatimonadales bacterium]
MTRAILLRLLGVLLLVPAAALSAQSGAAPAPALAVQPLAGQRVPVLPVTFLTADAPIDELLPGGRVAQLAWADSILGEALQMRGPEVEWLLAPELRRVARRAPATVTDPDRMGQAMMRSERIERVPDPLRSYLRSLTAMTNSRLVLIPAAVRFAADSAGGVRAEVSFVMADTRNGGVAWRSTPSATATTPARALEAVIARILPDFR